MSSDLAWTLEKHMAQQANMCNKQFAFLGYRCQVARACAAPLVFGPVRAGDVTIDETVVLQKSGAVSQW